MKRIQKEYLVRVCLQRLRGAKAEAAAIAARRRSEFKALLVKTYSLDDDDKDSHLGRMYKLAKSIAEKGNEEIARLAGESIVGLQFGPSLKIDYGDYPQYVQDCWDDDWREAERKIVALEREAAEQIERTSMDTLVQLMNENLTPAEVKKLVDAIPAAAELVPELKREDLKGEPSHAGAAAEGALDSAKDDFSLDSAEDPF